MPPGYPFPGCIVEFLEDNSAHIAMVLEDTGGKLRLMLPGRREVKLSPNRLLPWLGPIYPAGKSKEEIIKLLEQHRNSRERLAGEIPIMEVWELAQGEISQAPASWFADLSGSDPSEDLVAAYGRALLNCRTHFRFAPPEFIIYDQETVEKRISELEARREKEMLAAQGNSFIRLLWEVANKRKTLPPPGDAAFPSVELADRIFQLLMERMATPDSHADAALWEMISKGLPDEQHIPVRLLIAWGKLPAHYNFWLDRAEYAAGDEWWHDYAADVEALVSKASELEGLEARPEPFVSIDGPSTLDIDDAFYVEKNQTGWKVVLAFANPALFWPFGEPLDKLVQRRATSIYLPEGDLHMLPRVLGTDVYSLKSGQPRAAFCLELEIGNDGRCHSCRPGIAAVTLASNLRYAEVQDVLMGKPNESAAPFAEMLKCAHELAVARERLRIEDGAVIMLRQEPEIRLAEADGNIEVGLVPETPARDAQRLVSEFMILASSAIANWAHERQIPLLHRTQNVSLPKEYAGIWEKPEDLSRIMRALIPSALEVEPHPHAALGLSRYAQVTSPLRRYPDLINEAQIIHFLEHNKPRWDSDEMSQLINLVSPALDGAGHAQKFRPRYWKLLYLKQHGEKEWHKGIITEENDNFVNISLPEANLNLRGRRNLFDDRAGPGIAVKLRLGKINPILNEIQILEAISDDS